MELNNCVLLETLPEGRSLFFSAPVKIISTVKTSRVMECLHKMDALSGRGFYLAGYAAYEAGYAFEKKYPEIPEQFPFPLLWFGVYKKPLLLNNKNRVGIYKKLFPAGLKTENPAALPALSAADYKKKINIIKNHLQNGDIYQLNFTFPLKFSFSQNGFALYNEMKTKQPVKYSAFIRRGSSYICSVSPELFFEKNGSRMRCLPMKGTMPRGNSITADQQNAQSLKNSIKNRAENTMIADLIRNDLGKISRPGSIMVKKPFGLEKHETLFQMTTEIRSQLNPGIKLADIFPALFPCGSVTGAPKIRAMQIIKTLESSWRGVYTGTLGYITPGGKNAVFSVAIRTAELKRQKGRLGIGSGIVWDSRSDEEYGECLLKSAFLFPGYSEFKIIESLLLVRKKYYFLNEHLDRMEKSAACFSFVFSREKIVRALLKHARNSSPEARKIRLLLGRSGDFSIEQSKLAPVRHAVLKIKISDQAVNSRDLFLQHKTTKRRLFNEEFSGKKNCAEIIFCNERGEITEGSSNNIFIRKKNLFFTPPLS
ncbi:MAG: aminodeoxychorismate synthase, component I, partial [Spirochaetes bacterium GWF1_41_5]